MNTNITKSVITNTFSINRYAMTPLRLSYKPTVPKNMKTNKKDRTYRKKVFYYRYRNIVLQES